MSGWPQSGPRFKRKASRSGKKKDPRLVEVILKESRRIVRSDHVLIAETRHGFVCANAVSIIQTFLR